MTIAIFNWIEKFSNKRIFIFCDNMSVVQMVNNNSSKCRNCMVLIRMIVLKALTYNVKINVKHIAGKSNISSDLLSRLEYKKFRQHSRSIGRRFQNKPCNIPKDLWPMEKLWLNKNYQHIKEIKENSNSRKSKKKKTRTRKQEHLQ